MDNATSSSISEKLLHDGKGKTVVQQHIITAAFERSMRRFFIPQKNVRFY